MLLALWGSRCLLALRINEDMRIQQKLHYSVPICTINYCRRSSDLKSGMKLSMSTRTLRQRVSLQMG